MKKLLPMLLFFLVPAVSFGQGSRLDDVAFKNLVTGIAPAAGATVTVCTSAGTGIPCTPQATVYSDIALTQPITPPILADSNGYYGFYAAPGRYVVTVTGAGTSGKSITYILPCDPSGAASASCLTLAANNTFTGTDTFTGRVTLSGGIGANTFKGPSPWVDATDPQYGAKCDGSTDDTTAIQNALNAVAQKGDGTGTYNGGTVFIPPGKTGVCVVSTLNMDGMINVTVMSPGFTAGNPNANSVPSIKFTGTCVTGPCLSMKSTNGITFAGVGLFFSGATAGPMIDVGHCTVNCHGQVSDSAYLEFHGVSFDGPGGSPPTIGPIISITTGEFIHFDGWCVFQGASVFVKGANDNSTFTDLVTFDRVFFDIPGTAAIQNAGMAWSFNRIDYVSGQGFTTNCIPFLQYVGGNTSMQSLSITASEFNVGPVGCTNAFTLISIPAVSTNLGGLTFDGNLVLLPSGNTNGTVFNIGNNQAFEASGNVFDTVPIAVFTFGTGVSVDIGPNIYRTVTTFLTGSPSNGRILDNANKTTFYSGTNAPLSVLNASVTVGGAFLPSAAGNPDIGSTALPFGNLWLGTAATNNFKFQPAATAAARTVSILDPGAASTLDLTSNTTTTTTNLLHGSATAGVGTWSAFAPATDCATCTTNAAALTSNAVVLGGGGQAAKTVTAFTTNGTTTMTVGVAAGGNGVLALAGNTSGTATFTAPATAGTVTNPVVASNTLQLPGLVASGTAAALTGTGACATFSTQTGGAWAGRATCTAATAASTLIITPGATAPNGWVCYVQDQTTRANLLQQTSTTTTACTLTATSVTQNDVIVFTAFAF